MQTGCKGSHFENAYDFYKPVLSSEYPTVDGQYSIECYLRSLENCYAKFKLKWKTKVFSIYFSNLTCSFLLISIL